MQGFQNIDRVVRSIAPWLSVAGALLAGLAWLWKLQTRFVSGVNWPEAILLGLASLVAVLLAASAALAAWRFFMPLSDRASSKTKRPPAVSIEFGKTHHFEFDLRSTIIIRENIESAVISARVAKAKFYLSGEAEWIWVTKPKQLSDIRDYHAGETVDAQLIKRRDKTPTEISVLDENLTVSGKAEMLYLAVEVSVKSKKHSASAVELIGAFPAEVVATTRVPNAALNCPVRLPQGAFDGSQWPRGAAA